MHWSLMHESAVITDGAFDSQNLAFWDSSRNEYRAYWRYKTSDQIRSIRTATSSDFINWSNQRDLEYGEDAPEIELYTNVIKPYYRAPELLIGFPVRYHKREWSKTMDALPDLENRKLRATSETRFGTSLTESLLMVSRYGVNFTRWREAFLRPGIERSGAWNYGQQYIAWSMVETSSSIEGAPNEISIYAVEGTWGTIQKGQNSLRRYTLRQDGFVSVSASMKGGELLTKPFEFKGDQLSLNFSTSVAGGLRVEVQDGKGNPLPGFSLSDCVEVFGDTISRKVHWSENSNLSELQGTTIRLRFVMHDADLYSFKFE